MLSMTIAGNWEKYPTTILISIGAFGRACGGRFLNDFRVQSFAAARPPFCSRVSI